jgi:hypothetical protein
MERQTAIEYQTSTVKNEISLVNEKQQTYAEKSNYQMEMYNSVKFVNQVFLFLYVVFFSIIHLLLLVQYIRGVKRDEVADTIWLTILFWYPYLIYYVEKTIYFCITYFFSLIYGQTYVYQFDQLLLFTDFYADPTPDKNTGMLTG